ncbi:DUF58 domain-containing protein [Anaeromicropila populeti]|uniref:DUF58 domain-containing protein n=1 Tax=Anaeromicropila populeti TaxID=37658 RepID=A0A1I6L4C0_9FIRM|nr:DUF58 domain-containing protein [Anaeromicropila populeti]SFR98282.1 Protein of unknown function DUF58 [Anaeromicropila populeti]
MWQTRLFVLVCIIGTGIFASFYGGIIPYSLFYLALMLPVVSVIYTAYVFLRFKLYQDIGKKTLVKEETTEYTFQIENEDFVTYESVRVNFFDDYSTILEENRKKEYCLLPGQSYSMATSICCHYRGEYFVGIKSVVITDYLYLFSITYPVFSKYSVTVLPKILKLEKMAFLKLDEDAKKNAAVLEKEQEEPDVDVRKYLPGDDKRLIHWKASAKSNQLLVRKIQGIPKPAIGILLDLSKTADGENQIMAEDILLEAALSIMIYCVERSNPCTVVYEQGGIQNNSISNIAEFDSFYKQTKELRFHSALKMDALLETVILQGIKASQLVILTHCISRGLFEKAEAALGQGMQVSVIFVWDGKEDSREYLQYMREQGIFVTVAKYQDDLKKVLEEGLEN